MVGGHRGRRQSYQRGCLSGFYGSWQAAARAANRCRTNAKIRKRIMERLKQEGEVFVDPFDVAWKALTGRKLNITPAQATTAGDDKNADTEH
jgi:hypothetical protein